MIPYEDGLWTLLQLKGSVAPKALLLALPSLLFTILLYFVDREVSLEKISIGDVTVSQDEGLNCKTFYNMSITWPLPGPTHQVWSGLTVTLSILIGFRTQQALERFWEGRYVPNPVESGSAARVMLPCQAQVYFTRCAASILILSVA